MKNKIVLYIVSAYFVLLTVVLITQIPKKEIIATEPLAAELKYEDKLKNAVVLYVDSPVAIVNEKQVLIDNNNPEVTPIIKDGTTFIPVSIMSKIFNANVSYNKSETTIRLDNIAVVLKENSNKIKIFDNTSEEKIEASNKIFKQNNIVYAPIRNLTEIFEKELFFDGGLIVISNIEDIFDAATESDTIEELKLQVNNLPVIGSEEKLKELIGDENSIFKYGKAILFKNDSISNSTENSSDVVLEKDEAAKSSSTNVQVEGVDEADIIKNDGEYIYYTNTNGISIVKAVPANEMSVVSNISFDKDFNPSEIYINNDKLIVIGNIETYNNKYNPEVLIEDTTLTTETSEETTQFEEDTEDNSFITKEYAGQDCNIYIYDITDKSNTELLRTISVDGSYNSSRRIEQNLYVISNLSVFELYKNKRYITPSYLDSMEGNKRNYLDYNSIHYFPCMQETDYTIVTGINLEEDKNVNIYSYLGSGENIYVSNDSLYIANTMYTNYSSQNQTDDYDSKTYIYKFGLNGSNVEYDKKGNVFGKVLNQFSMDEHNGYFRIATNSYQKSKNKKSNNLFVLDKNLNVYGQINDIAPQEEIYSVRFMEDRAYMVTFKTTDPLFAIDLKSPKEPKILGALKIPGYSNYLHFYDQNHLIGFGKDAIVYDDAAYYTSMKISMFDVTDIENPVEQFTEIIGDRGTDSQLLSNHKALLFDKEKNILAFPISVYEKESQEESIQEQIQYGNFSFQGAYVYSIDMNNGFELNAKISHLSEEDYLKSANYSADTQKYIQRIIYIGDNIYTISDQKIKASNMKNFEEISTINLY